jgi:hypothetical protein
MYPLIQNIRRDVSLITYGSQPGTSPITSFSVLYIGSVCIDVLLARVTVSQPELGQFRDKSVSQFKPAN